MMNIISLGAGVQSSTMALMAAKGEITPMPDAAIFADTCAEPQEVYDWLDWLETQLPFPVYRVQYSDLKADIGKARPAGKYRKMPIPAFILMKEPDGSTRKAGLLRRQCTTDYKIYPLTKRVRQELGVFKKRTPVGVLVQQWIGISTDEATRMKPSRESYIEHRWPLIENDVSRADCLSWMKKHYDVTPPRSACTFCPFHSNKEWRYIRDNYPKEFKEAVEIDQRIRTLWAGRDKEAEFYLHKSMTPLAEADLEDVDLRQLNMFENECEGMCGV
ncbi:MAG: hypothetical protein QF732_05005 [Nitrospinaceae bacterium]|jgi:hypothetical protein|nr:hypothetical protein [Nitrospinaceae bacterium]